jgi:hypothetical protein
VRGGAGAQSGHERRLWVIAWGEVFANWRGGGKAGGISAAISENYAAG